MQTNNLTLQKEAQGCSGVTQLEHLAFPWKRRKRLLGSQLQGRQEPAGHEEDCLDRWVQLETLMDS